nr:recombinase family protein [Kibdelosporangium sp. MJ126-NF4]CEL18010.1 Serine phosphatase RsbU, regulator of sigma subunit [Kibdelosporangium sp. MJ126-NF4]CTQ90762.1 Serine phosphatase RsbU, regulator of sigma subunit [Kibdelosporangium sp. MJ126-NF4]
MTRYGYARVSTREQNPESQFDALTTAGIPAGNVVIEKITGKLASRPKLDHLLERLEPGDLNALHGGFGEGAARDFQQVDPGVGQCLGDVAGVSGEADGLSAPETLRRLMRAILDYQGGRLQDDASVLLVEWRSSHERRMVISQSLS